MYYLQDKANQCIRISLVNLLQIALPITGHYWLLGQERLSNLALLHIEREYVNKVLKEDMEEMIDTFGKRSGRNKYFFKWLIAFHKC